MDTKSNQNIEITKFDKQSENEVCNKWYLVSWYESLTDIEIK